MGRVSAPGLMTHGFLPRGKRRDAGCNSVFRGLPNGARDWSRGACPTFFLHGEITGNRVGFCTPI